MATPVSPLFIPSTIDTAVLNTTLADYNKMLTDNIYNSNTVLRLANEAGTKKVIDGGGSIGKMVERKSSYIGGHPERAIPRKDWKW